TEAMKYYAAQDEFVQNDEKTFDDQSIEGFDYGTFGKIDAAITPLRFGRFITAVTRTITVTTEPGDTIAVAHVQKDIVGVFKIKGLDEAGDTLIVEKPFEDQATRNIIFKRIARRTDRFWLNWVPVATSLVEGGTIRPAGDVDIAITKAELFLPNGTVITITDPNAYYLRYRWTRLFDGGNCDIPEFTPGVQARLQVTLVSTEADTDLVALRYGVDALHKRRVRMQLTSETSNGDGTYTRVYGVPFFLHPHRGWFHAGIDAMTKKTVFDDTAPYSVSWWGIPYRVF
ncbi:MAG: hypothetical protein OEM41_07335, partial [Ignavibacteria bacterium]|nr:hypothetical protein [Ignavibacteria bacterium]